MSSGKGHSRKLLAKAKALLASQNCRKKRKEDAPNEDITSSPTQSENVLSLPLVKLADRDRILPCFSSILSRSAEEGVGMEDLDTLQLELEALLSAVVVRSRALRKEIRLVNNAQQNAKQKALVKRSFTAKRGGIHSRALKKPKGTSRDMEKTPAPIKLTNVKSIPSASTLIKNMTMVEFEPQSSKKSEREEAPITTQSRYDLPNRFWASVEPYCAEITDYDIQYLKELKKECDPYMNELQRIPPLGPHYSYRWAREDLISERKEASGEGKDISSDSSPEIEMIFESVKKTIPGRAPTVPLTQRVVSALMDENIKVHGSESSNSKTVGGENRVPRSGSIRKYGSGSSSTLDRKDRKQNEEEEEEDDGDIDSLDGVDYISDSEDESDKGDEILQEIKRCQEQLRHINTFNRQHIRHLLHMSRLEIKRQGLNKMLQKVDNELSENYRHIIAAKQRKRPLDENERKRCWILMKERSTLIRQIDALKSKF